jgi:hypothetical protein
MAGAIVKLLRIVSFVICLLVIASFAIFAVGQTKTASKHQQEEVAGSVSSSTVVSHESGLHKAIDEASNEFTSPFKGIVSASSGEWAVRVVELVLSMIVYGFGLSYIARVLRVRV